jgi:hypothetical protein
MKTLFKRWAVAILVVPAIAWALRAIAQEVAQRRGSDSKAVKGLNLGSRVLRSR